MNVRPLFGWAAAALLGSAVVAGRSPQSSPAADQKQEPPVITVSGCVQKETDVLKRTGLAGSIGLVDEFVLTSASNRPAAPEPAEPRPDEPTGTSGLIASPGKVYRLTGGKEPDLRSFVGQRVEINGAIKRPSADARDLEPARRGNSYAELTPDKTPEITIASIKPVSGTCSLPAPR